MPIPKVQSDSCVLRNALDPSLYVLRQEFEMEMEKVMAKLASLEDQLQKEVVQREFAGYKVDPDVMNIAEGNETNAPTEPNLPEEVEVIEVEQHEDKEHHVGMVHFSLSAWTYPVVLGLADAGPWDVFFSVLLMFLNFGVQAMFSYIILGVDFMGEEFEEQVAFAKRWRSSFAHDWKYVDLTSRSLVTRVCGGDGSLMLANRQATLVEHINSYMGLKHDEFEAGFFQTGILLCTLCLLLWALCVYKEFRNIWLTLEGIWQLPRSPRTVLRGNVLQSVSKPRFKLLVSTCISRFVIALVLLISGTQWLARTTSITELMLNAVALNAILDVDEFLFAGFTPLSIQVAIENLQPMTIRQSRRRSQSESLVLFALLLFTILFPYLALLQPLGQTMLAVKWNLCAGNQEFAVAKNTNSQVIVGFGTNAASPDAANTVLELAVEKHVHDLPDEYGYGELHGYYITFTPAASFERARTLSMAQEADQYSFCIETEHLDPGGSMHGDPVLWYNVAAPRLRAAAALLGRPGVESCAEAADLCSRSDAKLLRMICGRTCNCTEPSHSPWLKVPEQGCSTACLNKALQKFNGEQCQDQPTDETWSELWDGYVPALNHWLGTNISLSTTFYNDILQWVAAVKAMGCPAVGHPNFKIEVTGQREWCAGDPNFFRPMALNCPVSCGCLVENPPSYCPPCSANASA